MAENEGVMPIDVAKLPPGPWKPLTNGRVSDTRGTIIATMRTPYNTLREDEGGREMARLCAVSPELLAEVRAGRERDKASVALHAARCEDGGIAAERAYAEAGQALLAARAATDAAGVV